MVAPGAPGPVLREVFIWTTRNSNDNPADAEPTAGNIRTVNFASVKDVETTAGGQSFFWKSGPPAGWRELTDKDLPHIPDILHGRNQLKVVVSGPSGAGTDRDIAVSGAVVADPFVAGQIEQLARLSSASTVGKDVHKQVTKMQLCKVPRFNNLRPGEHRSVVPVQLAVPAFQHIVAAAWGASEGTALQPEARDLRLAVQLGICFAKVYPDEKPRMNAITKEFRTRLVPSLGMNLEESTLFASVCDISGRRVREGAASPTLLFGEVKNEVGASGDAGFQGAAYYAHQIRQQPERLATSFCPAVLLECVGALLRIQGLAYVGGFVVCEPLTPFLNVLDINDRQPEQVLTLARCMRALRQTLSDLAAAEDRLDTSLPAQPVAAPPAQTAALSGPSPAPTPAPAPAPTPAAGQAARCAIKPWGLCATPMPHHLHLQIQEGIVQSVCCAAGERLLYQVSVSSLPNAMQQPAVNLVAFKYVRRYGVEVHKAWGEGGLAPRLLRYTSLGTGPWHEVVMEWLDPRQGWLPLAAFLRSGEERDAELERLCAEANLAAAVKYGLALAASVSAGQVSQLRRRVKAALEQAHQIAIIAEPTADTGKRVAKYGVHGDVRPPNALLQLPIPAQFQAGSATASVVQAGAEAGAPAAASSAVAAGGAGSAAVEAGKGAAASLRVDDLKVMFVDFDWAGLEGEARYPTQLNSKVSWADGTEPGGLSTQQHDLELLFK